MNSSTRNFSAKCPRCGEPHQYREVRFSAVNDAGYWKFPCNGCRVSFVIKLINPDYASASFFVPVRREGAYLGPPEDIAAGVAIHNLEPNKIEHRFNYATTPIYVCDRVEANLEVAARDALSTVLHGVKNEYATAINYSLSTSMFPTCDHVVVRVPLTCPCGHPHVATFYAKFLQDGSMQQSLDEYLLADVTGCSLEDQLAGLFTKSEAMAILEKLLIRWHLTTKAIIVASPFVGHQWMARTEKMDIWNWLLGLLDPDKAAFITRSKEFTSFKSLLQDVEGLDYHMLEEYGLESRLVAADTKKQDFHAKFFIGMNDEQCEVLSGSANLVNGKSIENLAFKAISPERCASRYLDKLNVKLPEFPAPSRHFVLIEKAGDEWKARTETGPRLAR